MILRQKKERHGIFISGGDRMNKGRYAATVTGVVMFLILFLFSEDFSSGAAIGLSNCAQVIIPSLFPFMVAASVLGEGELPPIIRRLVEPITRSLFGQPAESIVVILVGLFGGYPSGTRAAASLYSGGKLTEEQAKSLMLFCVNAGTGFCVNAVGISLMHSADAGKIIFLSLCISAVIIGFFTKPKNDGALPQSTEKPKPFSEIFVGGVASGASGILTVCAFTTLFSGLLSVVSGMGIGNVIPLACLLEVTSGCVSAAGNVPLPIIAGVCAFGGVCVHMQIFSLAGKVKPVYLKFLFFRLLHAVVSGAVCSVLLRLFPIEMQTFLPLSDGARLYSFSLPAAISLLFFSSLLIFDLDKQRKIC